MNDLLERCDFPPTGTAVNLAVSGGSDSVGLLFLARAAELVITVHHVNHHLRDEADGDAQFVVELATRLGYPVIVHDVEVDGSRNLEAHARDARYQALPTHCLTGHTMDDVAETVLMRLMRGTGIDGVGPLFSRTDRPLLHLRRDEIRDYLRALGETWREDASNADRDITRNAVRLDLLPLMNDIARRDVTPLVARFAETAAEESRWMNQAARADDHYRLEGISCHSLQRWAPPRLQRWLRRQLALDGYPPSRAEVERAMSVIRGEVTACELSGGRRLSRRKQHLALTTADGTTLAS